MTYLQTPCTHHGPVRTARLCRPWIVRVYRRIFGPGRRMRAVHWSDCAVLRVPAMGDGYYLTVKVRLTWCITGTAFEEQLVERIGDQRDALLERVSVRLRNVSRRYPPYDAATAERELHRVVAGTCSGIRFTFSGRVKNGAVPVADGELRVIGPHTIIQLDKPVIAAQQKAWDLRQLASNEHERSRELIGQLTERRRLWHEFLKEIEREWHSPYAAALSQSPDTVGSVVREMFDDRLDQVKEMTRELVEQVEQYGDTKDAFELMTENDTVLRRMMALLQIPDPSDPPTPPYGDGQANSPNGAGRK